MPLFKTILKYRQGHQNETTEADVHALLADDTERARLEKEAKETILLIRKLVSRNPQEAAATIAADDDVGDIVMSYYIALTACHWTMALYTILRDHPIIKEMEARQLAARSSTGQLATVHEIGEATDAI